MATTLLPKAGGTPKSKVILNFPADTTRLYWSWWDSTGQSKQFGDTVSGVTSYTIRNVGVGNWLFTIYRGSEQGNIVYLTITEDDQKFKYFLTLGFQLYASDFDWSSYGTLGVDYEIVDDDDNAIDQSLWSTTKNWKARLLTSGTVTPTKDGKIDVFLVGGGGGGGGGAWNSSTDKNYGGGGGGAGYTTTERGVSIAADASYAVTLGAGGAAASVGGETSAFGVTAAGGSGGTSANNYGTGDGGNGGSGGGNGGYDGATDGNGGTNCGTGQGTTTREFGEADGNLYASGGNGGTTFEDTPANSGDGGDAYTSNGSGKTGGSGIVVIRNARG